MQHFHRLPVCAACLSAVEAVGAGGCRQCGDLTPTLADDGRCLACRTAPPDYLQALAACRYGGVARELILQLKFRGLRPAARFWAARLEPLARSLPPVQASQAPPTLIPVPLGRRRHRERGYNQSAEIARHLARQLGFAFTPSGLQRRRETTPQSGLDRAARIRNLAGAFSASTPLVAGRRVLLIDDVFTTGATAQAAAAALRRAGAREIYVLTAARAEMEFAVRATGAAA